MKWGISKNPIGRYKMSQYGGDVRMQILQNFDTRTDALAAERYMTERHPGPWNLEPHAGSVEPSQSWEEDLRFVVRGGLIPE